MCISHEQLTIALEASERRIKEHMDLTVQPITGTQEEHHESLYDPKFGLRGRVQKIENYFTATLFGGGIIAGLISFKEKIIQWFS